VENGIADEGLECSIRHEINFPLEEVFEIEFGSYKIVKRFPAVLECDENVNIAVRTLLSACE